ncbi:hypothetical protein L9F63_009948, partial [Diploptera punctata]
FSSFRVSFSSLVFESRFRVSYLQVFESRSRVLASRPLNSHLSTPQVQASPPLMSPLLVTLRSSQLVPSDYRISGYRFPSPKVLASHNRHSSTHLVQS